MKFKRGDTLIEVALAIGIFSMVAIAVVSVMSGSMSSAQSALELTVTREAIDAQAEAIRFIQTSYVAGGDTNLSNNTKYAKLWHAITERAKEPTDSILKYSPSTCSELYNKRMLNQQGAFVINTQSLGFGLGSGLDDGTVEINDIIITPGRTDDGIFMAATTFPRLVYKEKDADGYYVNDNGLLDRYGTNTLNAIEGIYVVPVRDNYTTTIVDGGEVDDAVSAYYDFYIRTCWFAAGARRPSTISTVIRLYNPDAIATPYNNTEVLVSFSPNDTDSAIKASGSMDSIRVPLKETWPLPGNTFERKGFDFVGWSTKRSSTPEEVIDGINNGKDGFYEDGGSYTAPSSSRTGRVTLYAIWRPKMINVEFRFDANGGAREDNARERTPQIFKNVPMGSTLAIESNHYYDEKEGEGDYFTRYEYYFDGWKDNKGKVYCGGKSCDYTIVDYPEDGPIDESNGLPTLVVNLKAQWVPPNTRLIYKNVAIDSQECSPFRGCYTTTQIPSEIGLTFVNWCSVPVTNYVTCNGKTYQPGDYFPGENIGNNETYLYPTWKLMEFWVDANIYINCERFLGGKEGFNMKTFIDGKEVDRARHNEVFNGTKIQLTDIDFYQPVEFSREVRIEFYDVEGYHIANTDRICDGIPDKSYCTTHREDGKLVVELTVYNIPDGATLNSTHQYAINIEPQWISDEPMVLGEGVEECEYLEWEPLVEPEEESVVEP